MIVESIKAKEADAGSVKCGKCHGFVTFDVPMAITKTSRPVLFVQCATCKSRIVIRKGKDVKTLPKTKHPPVFQKDTVPRLLPQRLR